MGKRAFAGNFGEDNNHNVTLLTPDRTNPNNLQNESITENEEVFPDENATRSLWVYNYTSGHIINPLSLKINFVSEDGKTLQDPTDNRVSEGQIITFPEMFGYEPNYIKETNETITGGSKKIVSGGKNFIEWTVVYKKKIITPPGGLTLNTRLERSTNQDPARFLIGENQRLNVEFSMTKYVPNANSAKIKVMLPVSINEKSVQVPKHPNIKDYKTENGVLTISLQNAYSGISMNIPVLFKMNEYTTPENEKFILKTTMVNNNDKIIYPIQENEFSGYYKKPSFDILAGYVNRPELDGPRTVGNLGYVESGVEKKRVTETEDFNYNWRIRTGDYDILKRNVESYKIEIELPSYTAYDNNGNELIKIANFNQEKNESWVLTGNKLTYEKSKLNTASPEMPKLTLTFPDAKDGTPIDLSAKITLIPKDKGTNESLIEIQDSITIYVAGQVTENSFLASSPNVRWNKTYKDFIYDMNTDREKTIPWFISFYENYKTAKYENLQIELKNLDTRLKYETLTNTGKEPLTLKIYRNGKGLDEIKLNKGETSKTLPEKVDRIEVLTDTGKIIDKDTNFIVNVKVKNPERDLGSTQARLTITGKVDTTKPNGEKVYQTANGYDSFNVVPFDYKLQAKIASNKEGNIATGDLITYNVGLQGYVGTLEGSTEFFLEDLKNFRQVVLLPENIQLQDITLTEGFKNSPKSKYEIKDIGGNRQAVIFTAEKLNKGTSTIATINTLTSSSMVEKKYQTETYANWDNTLMAKKNVVSTPSNVSSYVGSSSSKDYVEYYLATVKAVTSEKYVKNSKGVFTTSSETEDGNIDYQLKVVNTSEQIRNNVEIVDILPFAGDSHGSEIDVTLRSPVNVTGATVLYTTDKHPTVNSNFTARYRAGVTGIKILINKIDKNTTFSVNVSAKANISSNLSEALKLSGKSAYNTILRKDDLTPKYAEILPVKTTFITSNSSIEFYKYGLKKSIFSNNYNKKPLAGAEFELRELDGNYIKSAVSGSDGKVKFLDVEAKDYIIRETKAPKGYEIGKDIRVLVSDFKIVNGTIKAILQDEIVNNAPRYGNLTINKVTAKNNPLPEIGFTIRGTDDTNKNFIKKVTTNNEGTAVLKKIPEGNYIVEETESGRFVPAPSQTFKVEQTPGDIIPDDQEISLSFANNQIKLKLKKVEYEASEKIPQDLTEVSVFNRKVIEGVKFNIDGKEYTTDKDGVIEVIVNTGRSINIKEVSAPVIYKKNTNTLTVKIEDDGRVTDLTGKTYLYDSVNIPNALKDVKAKIEINKVDDKNVALADATFEVTKTGEKGEVVKNQISNTLGKVNFELTAGNYELKEISAPAGYYHEDFTKLITLPENAGGIKTIETDTDKINSELAKDNCDIYTSEDEYIVRHIKYKVVNKPLNVKALKYETILQNVEKKDISNYEGKEDYKVIQNGTKYSVVKPLQGVKFDLYEGDIKIGSYQTGTDGYINFNNYKFKENGIYNLVETETLEGFKLEKVPTRINIKSLSKVEGFNGNININIENKRITGKIVISKYDKKTRTILPNQEFTLYDNTGKEISKKVTNSAGLIEFNNLTPGTYTFKETKVSGDYLLDDKVYTANITLSNLLHVEKIFNKPGSIDVRVTKVDDQGNPLEGVEFAIFKGDKMVYDPVKTNKDGIAIFKNVKIEEGLVVKETATIKGYQLNQEKITLDLQNKDKVEVKYTNHKAEQVLPDTGTLNELPFIGTAILLLALSIFLRKRKVIIK